MSMRSLLFFVLLTAFGPIAWAASVTGEHDGLTQSNTPAPAAAPRDLELRQKALVDSPDARGARPELEMYLRWHRELRSGRGTALEGARTEGESLIAHRTSPT
jgi:hypothetical protein